MYSFSLARTVTSLLSDCVFGEALLPLIVRKLVNNINGPLRLRLEWSDWSPQGARLWDAIGDLKPHNVKDIVGNVIPSSSSKLSSQAGNFCILQKRGLPYSVWGGWTFSFSSLGQGYKAIVLFFHQRNNSFGPVYFHGKMYILAFQGSCLEPLATEGMHDSDLFEPGCLRVFLFPVVDLFASRSTVRRSCCISPCSDPEAFWMDASDPFVLNWIHFNSI